MTDNRLNEDKQSNNRFVDAEKNVESCDFFCVITLNKCICTLIDVKKY